MEILSTILALTTCLSLSNFESLNYENDNLKNENINITKEEWHNDNNIDDEDTKNLFDKYYIDYDEAKVSSDIYIQEETLKFDEITNDNNEHNIKFSSEVEELHNEGYIKFITTAYAIGYYDGGIVYHVKVRSEQQKSFIQKRTDNLIIQHGENAVTFINNDYNASGNRYVPCTINWSLPGKEPTKSDINQELEPNYNYKEGGVYYSFKAEETGSSSDFYSTTYGYTTITGDYYLIATDTTEIQASYIHNYNIFVNSLSISFGNIGVGINIGEGFYDIMSTTPMILKGYKDRIKTNVLTLNPSDYGFEGQYYFYSKTNDHTINNFTFQTERLRCGYIENENINLSPNRNDAGEAYLVFKFNQPIYELDTHISYWSPNEYLYTSKGDSVYIQYMDKNGNWINCLDLLNCSLSTNRKLQDYYEFEFIEGTYQIRYIANKITPNTSRNKGRICIGETKFINYSID